jgi:hypothetical protein
MGWRSRLVVALLGILASGLAIAGTDAEVVEKGTGPPPFSGNLTPAKLPRIWAAPVTLGLGLRVTRRDPPVHVAEVAIELDRNLAIDTRGLPRCPLPTVRRSVEAAARECAHAVIGSGTMTLRVHEPGFIADPPFRTYDLLAFNGRHRGRSAILVRFTPGPSDPSGAVIVFELRRDRREGTISFVSESPDAHPSKSFYLYALNLELGRRFSVDGERRSYLSASCPAPRGFGRVNFAYATVSYALEDGSEVSSKLVKQCRVRP